jgi:hypothetical protein
VCACVRVCVYIYIYIYICVYMALITRHPERLAIDVLASCAVFAADERALLHPLLQASYKQGDHHQKRETQGVPSEKTI